MPCCALLSNFIRTHMTGSLLREQVISLVLKCWTNDVCCLFDRTIDIFVAFVVCTVQCTCMVCLLLKRLLYTVYCKIKPTNQRGSRVALPFYAWLAIPVKTHSFFVKSPTQSTMLGGWFVEVWRIEEIRWWVRDSSIIYQSPSKTHPSYTRSPSEGLIGPSNKKRLHTQSASGQNAGMQ